VGTLVELGVDSIEHGPLADELGAGELWREVVGLHEHGGLTPEQALATATDVPRRALDLPAGPHDAVACPGDPRALAQARPVAA
jgi:hypothetical protein